MTEPVTIATRVDEGLDAELDRLAKATGRTDEFEAVVAAVRRSFQNAA